MGTITSKTSATPAAEAEQQTPGYRSGNVTFSPELLAKLQDEQKMRIAKAAAQGPAQQIHLPNLDPIALPSAAQLERAMQFRKEAADRAMMQNARKEAVQQEDELVKQASDVLAQTSKQLDRFKTKQQEQQKKQQKPDDKKADDFVALVTSEGGSPAPMDDVFRKMRMFETSAVV